ncbi:hatching enzyme-like [Episyrphus balteatus]|uniref:hatching enzyme-like n=1 Tax=Episyrphus balteatus TaxID=286459 RepID=UPI0024863953|nr:hatching enzyme-like [Episyrphus balteatus]
MSCQNVFLTLAILLLSTVVVINTAPVETNIDAQMYLSQFGYLPEASSGNLAMLDEDTVTQAIQDFQEFAGLYVTGQLDSDTLQLMSLPRCGVKDKRTYSRSKRSYGWRRAWGKKHLTYRISQYTRRMDRPDVDAEIARAFNVWTKYTDLTFSPKSNGPVDIDIRFVTGNHGECGSFDGRGGTLAHAYHPENGDAHFDDAERWTINTSDGTNLFQVAAHEFGHSLGLDHSRQPAALMAAFYSGFTPNFRLHSDDIRSIQELYGRKTKQADDGENEDNSNKGRDREEEEGQDGEGEGQGREGDGQDREGEGDDRSNCPSTSEYY